MRLPRALLLATLITGVLSIADALLFAAFRGVPPARMLTYYASTLLGTSAFKGGVATAALGLLLYFCVVCFSVAPFLLIARTSAILRRKAIAIGLLYGFVLYVVINRILIPHTLAPYQAPPDLATLLNGILTFMFLVGLPVALIARRLSSRT